jgi:hypothetical protein
MQCCILANSFVDVKAHNHEPTNPVWHGYCEQAKKSRMKKSFILLSMVFLSLFAQAQMARSVIKTRPFAPITNNLYLAYEGVISPQFSLQAEVSYKWATDRLLEDGDQIFPNERIRVTPEARIYTGKSPRGPHGLFVGPFLRYSHNIYHDSDGNWSANFIGGGAQLGYQAIVAEVVSFDFFGGLGIGRQFATDTEANDTIDLAEEIGIPLPMFRMGFAMGVAF